MDGGRQGRDPDRDPPWCPGVHTVGGAAQAHALPSVHVLLGAPPPKRTDTLL